MAHPYRRQLMRFHRLHPWARPGLLKTAAIGALAAAVAVALLSRHQRHLDGHGVTLWLGSAGPSLSGPQVHRVEREQQLAEAFAAAFGGSDEVIRRVGAMREPTRFRAGLLISAPFGPVLLSEGQVLAPRATSTGKLAAVYLARQATASVRRRASFQRSKAARWAGSPSGACAPIWPLSRGRGQGRWKLARRQCSWTTLLELTPDGPAELVTIPTAFDNSEALLDGSPTRVEDAWS